MHVSDAAAEAVARVLVAHQRQSAGSCLCGWSRLGLSHPEHQAALVIEAAAPFIAAQAWDQGFKQGGPMHDVNMDDPDAHERNPYRSGEVAPGETPNPPEPEPWPAGLRARLIATGWLKK